MEQKKRTNKITQELRAVLVKIRDLKRFPKGYALTVANQVGCPRTKVYHTFTGNNSDLAIIEGLIGLAERKAGVETDNLQEESIDEETNKSKEALRAEIEALKAKNLLPKELAEQVAMELGRKASEIRYTISGTNSDPLVMKTIIRCIKQSKELQLLKRANRLLEHMIEIK